MTQVHVFSKPSNGVQQLNSNVITSLLVLKKLAIQSLNVFLTKFELWCKASKFNISLDNNNKSFYRSLNAIFGKIGRLASEDVIVTWFLLNACRSSCMVWMHVRFVWATNVHWTLSSQEHLWKFFRLARLMSSKSVKLCLTFVECQLILERKRKFLQKFCSCENGICQVSAFMAMDELCSFSGSLPHVYLY